MRNLISWVGNVSQIHAIKVDDVDLGRSVYVIGIRCFGDEMFLSFATHFDALGTTLRDSYIQTLSFASRPLELRQRLQIRYPLLRVRRMTPVRQSPRLRNCSSILRLALLHMQR